MRFEWDKQKNKANIKKHDVSFEVAKQIFDDLRILSVLDHKHHYSEERWCSIGDAGHNILLFAVHTLEENDDDKEIIRIISARKAEKSERQQYLHG